LLNKSVWRFTVESTDALLYVYFIVSILNTPPSALLGVWLGLFVWLVGFV
jgi:hypothetical protein